MKLAVVILNWNGKALLEQFLPFVVEYACTQTEIYVVDNASTDNSVDIIKKNFPQVKLIINKKNYGFAKGYNEALVKIEAEYYVLLNSDIEVTPGWTEHMIDFMDAHKNIAACQPKILDQKNKLLFEYAGAAGGFIDKLGFPFCRGRIFNTIEKDQKQYNEAVEVFWATGACLFVRASLFKEAGMFDEDFFAHMEEIDLCWRLKNMGYKIYCYPESVVYHVGGATLNKMSPQKTFLNFRNNLCLIYKNTTGRVLVKMLLKRAFLDLLAAFSFIFSNGFHHFTAVFKAYKAFYFKMRKNANSWKTKKNNPYPTSMYNKSIVFQYYINKKKTFSELNKSDFNN